MPAPWVQNYNPWGCEWLSTLVAAVPIVLLLGSLVAGSSAPRAAWRGLASALLIAVFVYEMPPRSALAAAGLGACFGLLPIGWIVLNAVFLYHLTVRSGQFDVVKRTVAAISPDRRMQALLIAFSFGTFLEGAAGFGTPVAISAALSIGLGFKPLYAAGLALIANTAPVAFGGLGTPILTLADVTGYKDHVLLSQMAGRQLPLFSLIIPAWLVALMAGWRGLKGCWPAIFVCGGTFAAVQFVLANYHGPTLVGVAGGLSSLVALAVFLRFWQPKKIWRFPDEGPSPPRRTSRRSAPGKSLTPGRRGCCSPPWSSSGVSLPPRSSGRRHRGAARRSRGHRQALARRRRGWTAWSIAPAAWPTWTTSRPQRPSRRTPSTNSTGFRPPGTSIFLAAVLSAVLAADRARDFFGQFAETLVRVRWAIFTIACMLALAYTTKYSGADATLGLAFTRAGWLYPFFAPMLGWLGVALTGSDTSSNALFGSLQQITAQQLGLNPILIVTSNSTGGVMGKMIDAQSIVVAAVATGQSGNEGHFLRFVFVHSVILAAMIGVLTLLQAHVLAWMVPVLP